MIKKFIALFDLHFPKNVKLDAVEKFMGELRPDVLVYGGDTWDCEPISHWGEENRFKEIGLAVIRKQLNEEAVGLRNLVTKHKKLSGAKEIHYLIGNHEAWIDIYQSKYGNASEPMTLDSLTKLSDLGVTIYEQGKPFKLGKLYFLHGDKISKSGNTNVARTAVMWYQAPILFGHYHTSQSYGNVSPIDTESPQIGHCVGCLTEKNPAYNKDKPNACINQFAYGYINTDNGHFNYYIVTLINDQFIHNGKVYK